MAQESYRVGEHVTVRGNKEGVSQPSSGVTSHKEKGPAPETSLKQKEFQQNSGDQKKDEDYRPGEHAHLRHEKKDVEQGGKNDKVDYSFLRGEPKIKTTKVDCDPQ
jgi:hypothetical protein